MDKIQVQVIGSPIKNMSPFLARLTQRGHKLQTMEDLQELLHKDASDQLRSNLASMNHGTIKRFDVYTVAIVGASRRFLAQIRTHQHADFVSGSLQYSDWSSNDPSEMFVVPYEIMEDEQLRKYYLDSCRKSFVRYQTIAEEAGNDAAGFILPNGIRNVLIIQANAQEWQYMIGLRTCRRNSLETRYVMLRIWEQLQALDPNMFRPFACGPSCQRGYTPCCSEGKFSCSTPICSNKVGPTELIASDFPLLVKED